MRSQHFCLQVPNKNNVHSYIHVYLIVLLLITIILVARVSVGLGISFRCFAWGGGEWGESQKEKRGGGEGKTLTNSLPSPLPLSFFPPSTKHGKSRSSVFASQPHETFFWRPDWSSQLHTQLRQLWNKARPRLFWRRLDNAFHRI